MDIFTQKKYLVRITILLVILNLSLIGCVLWKDYFRKPPRQENMNESRDVSIILKKELQLSDIQVDQLKKLRAVYFEKERIISDNIKSERDSINSSMFSSSTNEDLISSLARRVAENEYRMELLRFEQAKELKTICTPDQLKKFEGLVIEIRDYFRNDNRPDNKRDNNKPGTPRPGRKNKKQ